MSKTKLAKAQEGQSTKLTPKQETLLYLETLPEPVEGPILHAIWSGAGVKTAAEAGGLTLKELNFIFRLAEQGHAGFRTFRDEFNRQRADNVTEILTAVNTDAKQAEAPLTVRKYALNISDPEAFPDEEAKAAVRPASGTMLQAGQMTVHVQTEFSDEDVIDTTAEVVE